MSLLLKKVSDLMKKTSRTRYFWLSGFLVVAFSLSGCSPRAKERYVPKPADPDAPGEFTKHESGIEYRILRKTNTKPAGRNDVVTVNYRGTLSDGYQFESSYVKGHPATFRVGSLVKGMQEGLKLIGKGGMIEIIVPPELAYGSAKKGNIPANSTLKFLIEVERIQREKKQKEFRLRPEKPLEPDPDAPAEFSTTQSGVKYRLLVKSDRLKPISLDSVALHHIIRLGDKKGDIYYDTFRWKEGAEGPLNTLPIGFREGIKQCPTGGAVEFIIPPGLLGDRTIGWLKNGREKLDPIPENTPVYVRAEVFAIQGKDYPR